MPTAGRLRHGFCYCRANPGVKGLRDNVVLAQFLLRDQPGQNWIKRELADVTNLEKRTGCLADMLVGADVFIGVSAPGLVTAEMVQTMNQSSRPAWIAPLRSHMMICLNPADSSSLSQRYQ